MKKIMMVLVFSWTGMANAALLTFDDIGNQMAGSDVVNYQGFNFSRNLEWIDLVGTRWSYGTKSGEFAVRNNYGGIGFITQENGDDFTFDGLWAKRWATAPESGGSNYLNGSLLGYNNGNLIWSVSSQLNGSYQFFGPQSGAIDELRLGFGDHFLVDDIALNEPQAISNPMSLLLLGTGLLGMVGIRRKALNH